MNKYIIFVFAILAAAISAQSEKPKDGQSITQCLEECRARGEKMFRCTVLCNKQLGINLQRKKKGPFRNNQQDTPISKNPFNMGKVMECMRDCHKEGKDRAECIKKCRPVIATPQKPQNTPQRPITIPTKEERTNLRNCMTECMKKTHQWATCAKECRTKKPEPKKEPEKKPEPEQKQP